MIALDIKDKRPFQLLLYYDSLGKGWNGWKGIFNQYAGSPSSSSPPPPTPAWVMKEGIPGSAVSRNSMLCAKNRKGEWWWWWFWTTRNILASGTYKDVVLGKNRKRAYIRQKSEERKSLPRWRTGTVIPKAPEGEGEPEWGQKYNVKEEGLGRESSVVNKNSKKVSGYDKGIVLKPSCLKSSI